MHFTDSSVGTSTEGPDSSEVSSMPRRHPTSFHVTRKLDVHIKEQVTTAPASAFRRWFYHKESSEHHSKQPWYKVVCLTGVDYFSTLGYQPSIAFTAAGILSPIATLILVVFTLFGALPIYNRVAAESPRGQGSIAMLENLLPRWWGKLFTLCMLGFAHTGFVITITLSAADATAHIVENPLVPHEFNHPILVTLFLIGLLGVVFLKGFTEAIGLAVSLVVTYLGLNAIVIAVGLYDIATHPVLVPNWSHSLFELNGNPLVLLGLGFLLFPKLALGLSGFETGVAVMPLVKGNETDTERKPSGRIRNTRKLLLSAALIMSVYLITSSLVTTLLIPAEAFAEGGEATGRALAYLAHEHLGHGFGTVYDLVTIAILWFAGASAMVGLLNLVPQYMPRYGMAPSWSALHRPLVVLFTGVSFAVTLAFEASVEAQASAYATGVLALMGSGAVAVVISAWKKRERKTVGYGLIATIFVWVLLQTMYERPSGLQISAIFIGCIILISFISRIFRAAELRITNVEFDYLAIRIIRECIKDRDVDILAHKPHVDGSLPTSEALDYEIQRALNKKLIQPGDTEILIESFVNDPSVFNDKLVVKGYHIGDHLLLRCYGPAVPNSLAALGIAIHQQFGVQVHLYTRWTNLRTWKDVAQKQISFILLGEGDTGKLACMQVAHTLPTNHTDVVVHAA